MTAVFFEMIAVGFTTNAVIDVPRFVSRVTALGFLTTALGSIQTAARNEAYGALIAAYGTNINNNLLKNKDLRHLG